MWSRCGWRPFTLGCVVRRGRGLRLSRDSPVLGSWMKPSFTLFGEAGEGPSREPATIPAWESRTGAGAPALSLKAPSGRLPGGPKAAFPPRT